MNAHFTVGGHYPSLRPADTLEAESTIDTVRENVRFLATASAGGAFPVGFCKMLPYAGTPIEARLRSENRLRGTFVEPDYDFRDPRLDWYALHVGLSYNSRNADRRGLLERLRSARTDALIARLFGLDPCADAYAAEVTELIAQGNAVVLSALNEALDFIEAREPQAILADWRFLSALTARAREADQCLHEALDGVLWRHHQGSMPWSGPIYPE